MLSAFGKMLFGGRTQEPKEMKKVVQGVRLPAFFSISSVFNNGIMILLASLIVVLGFTVPGFIDNTIRTCIDILGVK